MLAKHGLTKLQDSLAVRTAQPSPGLRKAVFARHDSTKMTPRQ